MVSTLIIEAAFSKNNVGILYIPTISSHHDRYVLLNPGCLYTNGKSNFVFIPILMYRECRDFLQFLLGLLGCSSNSV